MKTLRLEKGTNQNKVNFKIRNNKQTIKDKIKTNKKTERQFFK